MKCRINKSDWEEREGHLPEIGDKFTFKMRNENKSYLGVLEMDMEVIDFTDDKIVLETLGEPRKPN